MPLIATRFEHPLGDGILTRANDGDGYYTAQGHADYLAGYGYHLGEDWNGEGGGNSDLGDPVYAAANGRVSWTGTSSGWGKVVIVEHTMPDGSIVSTLYGHLHSIDVSVNDDVSIGETIGDIGTGGGLYAAHLHFAVYLGVIPSAPGPGYTSTPDPDRFNSGYVDPTWFVNQHRTATYSDNAGNSATTATAMTLGLAIEGSVGNGADTDDYFSFTATRSGTVSIALSGMSADIDLRLLNSNGSVAASSVNSGSNDERVSTVAVTAGSTYYIHVDPYQSATSDYQLTSIYVTHFVGNSLNNSLSGDSQHNRIFGFAGDDRLYGYGGNDTLDGGAGKDYLDSGSGNDAIVFRASAGTAHADQIANYDPVRDRMLFDDLVYSSLSTGTISSSAFQMNSTGFASDSSDRFIYENDTGRLYYDSDGFGGAGRLLIATLNTYLSLTHQDFIVY